MITPQTAQPTPNLDPLFAALADPTRRAMVERLARGETTVGALAEPFDMSAPAVSRHLKVLERAGLVERRVAAQWRYCRLRPEGLKAIDDWMDAYRRFWNDAFDRLDDHLAAQTDTAMGETHDPDRDPSPKS